MHFHKILKYDSARLALMNYIAEKQLVPGDKLPSLLELSSILNISMITLRHAVGLMAESGFFRMISRGRKAGIYLQHGIQPSLYDTYVLYLFVSRENVTGADIHDSFYTTVSQYFTTRGIGTKLMVVNTCNHEVVNEVSGAAAVIVTGWVNADFMKSLSTLQTAMILLGNYPDFEVDIPCVRYDQVTAAYLLTKLFLRHGKKQIGLLSGELQDDYYTWHELEQGYSKAMSEAGLPPQVCRLNCAENEYISTSMDEYILQHPEIEALLLYGTMLNKLISCFWRYGITSHPCLGFLSPIDEGYEHKKQSEDGNCKKQQAQPRPDAGMPHVAWVVYDSVALETCRRVHDFLLNGGPITSCVIEAHIPGFESEGTP